MLEDKIRTALRAEGERLNQVGPLRLRPARAAARARPVRRAARRGGGRTRSWLAPAAAAAMVAVVAVALVTVRSARNDTHAAAEQSAATAVPRYGVGLTGYTSQGLARGMVVTDTLTGATVASITAPKGTSYTGVSGAADNRTFAVGTTLARNPPLPAHLGTATAGQPGAGPTGWYLLRISPGAPDPARLTRLPIPASEKDSPVGLLALSPSGTQIAMLSGNTPGIGGIVGYKGWLRVYSVATGQLLRAWTAAFSADGDFGIGTALTWIHGDSGLALTVISEATTPIRQKVRVMDMTTGDASGKAALGAAAAAGEDYPGAADLLTDSQVVWSGDGNGYAGSCGDARLVADGSTVVCDSWGPPADAVRNPDIAELLWLAYPVSAPQAPQIIGRVRLSPPIIKSAPVLLWASADGRTVLAAWIYQHTVMRGNQATFGARSEHIGIASSGRVTALPSNPIMGSLADQFNALRGNMSAW
jgi:hypothetical protein